MCTTIVLHARHAQGGLGGEARAAGWMFKRETAYHRVWDRGNVRIPVPKIDILDEQVA